MNASKATRAGVAAGALAACLAGAADALIVYDTSTDAANPPAHEQAPPGIDGWNHVGRRGVGTGVYLGHGWVATADHVGPGGFELGGTSYPQDFGEPTVRLANPDPADGDADVVLFKIVGDPGLAPLPIARCAPAVGQAVTMIGTGLGRGSALKDVDDGSPPDRPGFDWADARTRAWADNTVSTGTTLETESGTNTLTYRTAFDAVVGEGQAANHDSGGAVFLYNPWDGRWELSGLIYAIDTFDNQAAATAAVGNATRIADLSAYRQQIGAHAPEPATAALWAIALAAAVSRRPGSR